MIYFMKIQLLGILNMECEQFEKLFMKILNYHAPLKTRLVRANNSPFMTKELYKAIITRSRLRNKFHKLKTTESNNAYKKQRNYLRATKRSCYGNLNPNLITDSRKFWKHV